MPPIAAGKHAVLVMPCCVWQAHRECCGVLHHRLLSLLFGCCTAGMPAPDMEEPTFAHCTARPVLHARYSFLCMPPAPRPARVQYYTMAKFVDMGNPEPLTLSGRLVAMAYGFMIIIMMNLYTANTAAAITTRNLNTRINSKVGVRTRPGPGLSCAGPL